MPKLETVQSPTRKAEATHVQAVAIFLFVFVPLVGLVLAARAGVLDIWPLLALSSVLSVAIGLVAIRRSYPVPRGRKIGLVGTEIRQTDESGDVVASLEASRPYHYQVNRLGLSDDAIVRLIQGQTTVSFYLSDPGGADLRETVLGFRWPPPPNPKR